MTQEEAERMYVNGLLKVRTRVVGPGEIVPSETLRLGTDLERVLGSNAGG